jgi:hypothetical protein
MMGSGRPHLVLQPHVGLQAQGVHLSGSAAGPDLEHDQPSTVNDGAVE